MFFKVGFLALCFLFQSIFSLNIFPGEKWPNGVVKYKIDSNVPLKGIAEVHKAIDEYHSKTCIKFEPWKVGDVDFVSIEVNNTVTCGSGSYCKVGGKQRVRLNENCWRMNEIVEILGFALCLTYEHRRADRDNYVSFQNQCSAKPEIRIGSTPMGIYDYESRWHWQCNECRGGWPTSANVTKCGWDYGSNNGLSVRDADYINALYNCQGCRRHRWRPAGDLTRDVQWSMYSFGYTFHDGHPVYPCRARAVGSIYVGMFNASKKSCIISVDHEIHEIMADVEILTIPGGLNQKCSIYKLVDKKNAQVETAVPAGSLNSNNKWRSYIAYAPTNGSSNVSEYSVRYALVKDGYKISYSAKVPGIEKSGEDSNEQQILTCVNDATCMLNQLYSHIYDKEHELRSVVPPRIGGPGPLFRGPTINWRSKTTDRRSDHQSEFQPSIRGPKLDFVENIF